MECIVRAVCCKIAALYGEAACLDSLCAYGVSFLHRSGGILTIRGHLVHAIHTFAAHAAFPASASLRHTLGVKLRPVCGSASAKLSSAKALAGGGSLDGFAAAAGGNGVITVYDLATAGCADAVTTGSNPISAVFQINKACIGILTVFRMDAVLPGDDIEDTVSSS